MIFVTILFLSVAAFAHGPAHFTETFNQTAEKPFHAVSDDDMKTAPCLQTEEPTEDQMLLWVNAQAEKLDGGARVPGPTTLWGLEIRNESAYRFQLLEKLLTAQPWSDFPQASFRSACHDVVCIVKDLFGPKVGVQLLYMLSRHGFNGSHLRLKEADAWTPEELNVVLRALADIPTHLQQRPAADFNHTLIHFKRTYESPSMPLANAIIYVYNEWNRITPNMQRYAIFHEVGHNMGIDFGFDSLKAWYKAADWSEKDFDWTTSTPEKKISQYAEFSPEEDFAESFAAYRYNAAKLKTLNPAVYQFMKKRVFNNKEYTSTLACQQP